MKPDKPFTYFTGLRDTARETHGQVYKYTLNNIRIQNFSKVSPGSDLFISHHIAASRVHDLLHQATTATPPPRTCTEHQRQPTRDEWVNILIREYLRD